MSNPDPTFLGEPVDPPWSEVHQNWLEQCRHRPPRTFMQIFDAREGRSVRSRGFSLLGYRDDREFNTRELLSMTHGNQQRLLAYQTERVYRGFAEKPQLIKGKKVVYCNLRSFRDTGGQYWRVHQASVPVQYDAAGRLVRYQSFYRIVGKYQGEPFETEIYTDPTFPEEERLLLAELRRIKQEVLQGLGFSPREEQLIRLMAAGSSSAAAAETMGINRRTIDKHRRNILDKGRLAFPLNDFATAADVVRYLVRQWLV
jgi:hypothetical protein